MNKRRIARCRLAATVCALVALTGSAGAQEPQQGEEPTSQQEPLRKLFVSDKLVLNVYAQPDQGSERVATIQTGDTVDELERAENFVRIRLEDAREGWVGSNYLTTEQPAAARLRELQREQKSGQQSVDKKAAEEIARLKKESAALLAQVSELKSAAARAPAAVIEGKLEGPQEDPPPVQAGLVPASDSRGLAWAWAFAVVVAGGFGFAGGYQTLARRIKKKFGGLRIY